MSCVSLDYSVAERGREKESGSKWKGRDCGCCREESQHRCYENHPVGHFLLLLEQAVHLLTDCVKILMAETLRQNFECIFRGS